MKVLILGGKGFAGTNVTEILKKDHDVVTLSRKNGLDLIELEQVKNAFAELKPDVIVNCAADVGSLNYVTQIAAIVLDNNMRMLLNMYKAANETIPKVIIINPVANCTFPGNIDFYEEDKIWDGKMHQSVLSYGSSRRLLLVLSECYNVQYGLRTINYFVPNMYGPHDSTDPNKAHALNALISKVVKAKKEGNNKLVVWGSGVAIREWLFVKDFARIVYETINHLDSYYFSEDFNIGQNFGLSVRDLVNVIIKETDYKGTISWDRSMPDGAPKKVMDDRKFRKIFPDFEFTSLSKGIADTINYYESVYPY